jgi:hypothetical protein
VATRYKKRVCSNTGKSIALEASPLGATALRHVAEQANLHDLDLADAGTPEGLLRGFSLATKVAVDRAQKKTRCAAEALKRVSFWKSQNETYPRTARLASPA